MKQKLKLILFYLPKIIIFGLALLNFSYIQSHMPVRTGTAISFPAYTPWYETSDFSYVLIILAASVSLLVSNRTSYIIAGVLSAYIAGIGVIQLFIRKMSLLERWQGIQKYEMNIFLTIEVQWILAIVVFSFTILYLLRDVLGKKYSYQ